ncbi:hypothetical protein BJ875DRAFT_487931 [Amylocarpus encephaloides]|uniref:Uncharacterized protein n=1 Tax=Amylocarpus encephaloides TaxID=45428 RepID=A0A9P7YB60_9HELO|nr:hypothetical protein BJ875DRAFT_487931 [Amylocarpus encephaloides]
MDTRLVDDQLKSVASYGGQISSVFHQYALIANKIPKGFEGATNILDATVATLRQVSGLFEDQVSSLKNPSRNSYFNSQGNQYVQRLVEECAKSLMRVSPIITDACLPYKEFRAKFKRDKILAKGQETKVSYSELKIDQKILLAKLEKARWSLAGETIDAITSRLYDLQLHILLVFQVVTVGAISKNLSDGKDDVQAIVTFYDRIHRTANLVGVKAPKSIKRETISLSSDDDSSSFSESSLPPSTSRRKKARFQPPPPPPPPPPKTLFPLPPPHHLGLMSQQPPPPPPPPMPSMLLNPPMPAPHIINPPSYTDSASTKTPKTTEKDEKTPEKAVGETESSDEEDVEVVKPEPRLFKSKSNGFTFKLRSLFRSKQSLAAEMQQALCDTDSYLMAFVVQGHGCRLVPHSVFHSLEATHMRTILSQLNDDTWYKTFASLSSIENNVLGRILRPQDLPQRQMVVLKAIIEEGKPSAWMALARQPRRRTPAPAPMLPCRTILAILRAPLVDGKPVFPNDSRLPPPPPPPPFTMGPIGFPPQPPPFVMGGGPSSVAKSALRPPPPGPPPAPGMWSNRTTTDLTPTPPGVIPRPAVGATPLGGPPPGPPRPYYGPPPPPPAAAGPPAGPPIGPPSASKSIHLSDITLLDDAAAELALTSYNEYTMRMCDKEQPNIPRSWLRTAITLEVADKMQVKQRAEQFVRVGGNVTRIKMRLTDEQADQITRLMDDLRASERDFRFEWFLAELSLYDRIGEIRDLFAETPNTAAARATVIHLIAKRTLKPHYRPLETYNALIRASPYQSYGRGPPPPSAPHPIPHGLPPYRGPPYGPRPGGPTRVITPAVKKNRLGRYSSSSDSSFSSDTSDYDSDSSVRIVRKNLRRVRIRKQLSRCRADSDDDIEDDPIRINLSLKKGEEDGLVRTLLNMWTPMEEEKGMEVVVVA